MRPRHTSFFRSAATSATHRPCPVPSNILARNIALKNPLARQFHVQPPGPVYPSFRDSLRPPRPNTILGRIRFRKDGKPRSKLPVIIVFCIWGLWIFAEAAEEIELEERSERCQKAAFRVDAEYYDSLNTDDIEALTAYVEKLEEACELEDLGKLIRRGLAKLGKEELVHKTMRRIVEDTHSILHMKPAPTEEEADLDDEKSWNIVLVLIVARYCALLATKNPGVGDPDSVLLESLSHKDVREVLEMMVKVVPPRILNMLYGQRKHSK